MTDTTSQNQPKDKSPRELIANETTSVIFSGKPFHLQKGKSINREALDNASIEILTRNNLAKEQDNE